MKFGIFDHLDRRDEPLQQYFNERLAFTAAAEKAGFYGYHIAEHHGTPLGMAPSPSVYLAAVARETSTLRFGPMMYLLPLYEPLRLIEEIGMLDNLSGGRLEIGVGRGVSPHEIGFFGVAEQDSFDIYSEVLDIVMTGLTEKRLSWNSERYHYDDIPMELPVIQKPIPLWSAPGSPGSYEISAKYGMNVVSLGPTPRVAEITANYLEAWERNKDHPLRKHCAAETPTIGAYRHVYVAETEAEAERFARPAYDYWFANLYKLWGERGGDAPFLRMNSFDLARDLGVILTGTPDQVSEILAAQREQAGFNYPILQFCFGNLGHDREIASLELFAEQVMPAFAD